jgi:hypothetical protein
MNPMILPYQDGGKGPESLDDRWRNLPHMNFSGQNYESLSKI